MPENKKENEVVRLANLLAEHGYGVQAVMQECLGTEITVMVSPPSHPKDTRK